MNLWAKLLALIAPKKNAAQPAAPIVTKKPVKKTLFYTGKGLIIHGEPFMTAAPAAGVASGGSREMPRVKYSVRFYDGYYGKRQRDANRDGAICFVAHHFNSSPSASADYALCVVADNASLTGKAWAADYIMRISNTFDVPKWNGHGVCVGGMSGRGNSQIRNTLMPAILCEPLFGSNPHLAYLIRQKQGQRALADCLTRSIRQTFPDGGLVAFSVGHKYKPAPHDRDRGAALHGGGMEADYAEMVLQEAARMLEERS